MARTWSWNNAVKGKREYSNNNGESRASSDGIGFVKSSLAYEMGDLKRVTIPYVVDDEGKSSMIIKTVPVHKVSSRGFIKLEGPKGNAYSPYTIRCMNPLSQVDTDERKMIAERKQFCALCTLANLQTKARFAKLEEKYGSTEAFKAIPKENAEKKAFIDELNGMNKIESSYNSSKKETNYETHMLILDFETTVKEIKTDFGIEKVSSVVLDVNGLPKFTPTYMKVSKQRLEKFQKAFQTAGRDGKITADSLFGFSDIDGEEVKTAFIDFELDFPVKAEKMNSAAEMTVRAVSTSESAITPEFVEYIKGKSGIIIDKAEKAWVNSFKALQPFTNEEYKSAMSDGGQFFETLKAEYFDERDLEFAQKVLKTALGDNQFAKKSDDGSEGQGSSQTAPTEKPVKEETSTPSEDMNVDDLLNITL